MIKASDQQQFAPTKTSAARIYFYAPNIVDYLRVIINIIAFYFANTRPILFVILYGISYFLDDLDGILARLLNQKSTFGATIDMIIDRISTSGLLIILAGFYPNAQFLIILLMMLDISSHWLQTESAIYAPDNENHKNFNEKYGILNMYYKNRMFLTLVCNGAEFTLLGLYYLHFDKILIETFWFKLFLYASLPWYVLKQFISVLQIISASERIVSYDLQKLTN
jgi:CDP-diacylglycerol--inositol 3-phosphatidyltransferase